MVNNYVPDQTDIIYLDLNPQKGSEMAKRRPCLVLSKKELNKKLGRVIIIPITSRPPRIKTHISLPDNLQNIKGTLIIDQIKSLDFRRRNAKKIDYLNDRKIYSQILEILNALIRL